MSNIEYLHSGKAGYPVAVQSMRLNTSATPTLYSRTGGFLDNCWSSVYVGGSWIPVSTKDGHSSISKEKNALTSKEQRQAGIKQDCFLHTPFPLDCGVLPTLGEALSSC